MEPGEAILALSAIPVRNSATGAIATMLAVGTAFPGPDDVPVRGRLLLFEATCAPPAGADRAPGSPPLPLGYPGQRWSARLAAAVPVRGPVSALCPLEGSHRGYLLAAAGRDLGVFSWNGVELRRCALLARQPPDTKKHPKIHPNPPQPTNPHPPSPLTQTAPHYCVALTSIKNYVLCADALRGLLFVQWRDVPSTGQQELLLLGKTAEEVDCAAAEVLVDGSSLALTAVVRGF